jgi:hypothetical protein
MFMKYRRYSSVMWLMALCVCAGYFKISGWMPALVAHAQVNGPSLSIPTTVVADSPGTVTVPIQYMHGQHGIAALTFSLIYDPDCLRLDVEDGEAFAGAVNFLAPPQFNGSIFLAENGDGKLDIALADYAPPLSTLPNVDPLIEVRMRVLCVPEVGQTIVTPLRFSPTLPASFGNTLGRSIRGSTVDGAVVISRAQVTVQPTPSVTPDPNVTPEPVNTAPIAQDDTAGTSEFRPVRIDVLANDTDIDKDLLTILEVTQGGFGQVIILDDSTLQYTPEPGRNGSDLFSYIISDGHGGLSEALVYVTVSEFNIPPVAQDDQAVTDRNIPVIIAVLENDFDQDPIEGDAGLAVFVVGPSDQGLTRANVNNTVTFTPTLDFTGETSFRYSIIDGEGGSGVALVTVLVRAVNRPPRIDLPTETLSYKPGGEVQLQIIATDPDGDTDLLYSATGLPPGLSMHPATGKVVGTIDLSANGSYLIKVVVSDGQSSATIEFLLAVTPVVTPAPRQYLPLVLR